MELLHDPVFWWALAASIWATLSDYIGSRPEVRQNAVYQLILSAIGNAIRGEAAKAGRERRRGRRG